MILVLTGTGPDSFDRLIKPLDRLAIKHNWEIFIQLGHTKYMPKNCKYERFIERSEIMEMISKSTLVVTQGGYGSIRDALSCNKPVVAVPRMPEFGESPDHQDELVRAMEDKGYLIGVYDIDDLEEKMVKAIDFTPSPREISNIPELIREYLSSL